MSRTLDLLPHESSSLALSARDLALAARELRDGAAHFDATSDESPRVLASLADAFRDLEGALAAFSAGDRLGDAPVDPNAVEALRWHLMESARRTRAAGTGCEECARWARQLSEGERGDSQSPGKTASPARRRCLLD